MIWDVLQASTFNDYFTNPSLTFDMLLKDQNIISQMKNLNPQLLNYIKEHNIEVFSRMIQYVIEQPVNATDPDRAFLFPYVSSQILAIDSDIIYQAFWDQSQNFTQHWTNLMNFLQGNGPENLLLLGYFIKVLNNLYKGRKQLLTKTILSNEPILNHFLKWVHLQSIAQFIKDLIVLQQTPEGVLLAQRNRCIQKILTIIRNGKHETHQKVDEQFQQSVRSSVCKFIITLIIKKFQTFSSGDELIKCILQSQTFLSFYQLYKSQAIILLLTDLLSKTRQTISSVNDEKIFILPLPEKHRKFMTIFVYEYFEGTIQQKIAQPSEIILNQSRTKVKLTKKQILNFCEFLLELTKNKVTFLGTSEQLGKLGSSFNIIQFLWLSFQEHTYNDILQIRIINILQGNLVYCKEQIVNKIASEWIRLCAQFNKANLPHLYQLENYLLARKPSLYELAANEVGIDTANKINNQYLRKIKTLEGVKWGTNLTLSHVGNVVIDQFQRMQNSSSALKQQMKPKEPQFGSKKNQSSTQKKEKIDFDPFGQFMKESQPKAAQVSQVNPNSDFFSDFFEKPSTNQQKAKPSTEFDDFSAFEFK